MVNRGILWSAYVVCKAVAGVGIIARPTHGESADEEREHLWNRIS
jgi:hypothetical protein